MTGVKLKPQEETLSVSDVRNLIRNQNGKQNPANEKTTKQNQDQDEGKDMVALQNLIPQRNIQSNQRSSKQPDTETNDQNREEVELKSLLKKQSRRLGKFLQNAEKLLEKAEKELKQAEKTNEKAKEFEELAEKEEEEAKRQHKKAYDENREAEGLKEKAEVLRESAYQHDQHAEVEENRAERLRGRADQLKKEATVHREMHLMKNLNQMRNLVTSIDSDTNDFARVKINQMTPISDRVREKADWHGEGKNKFSGKTNETRSSREHNETNPMRNLVITYNPDDKSSDSKESDSDSESESSSNEKETSESAETSKESKSKESKSSQESKSEKSIVSLQERRVSIKDATTRLKDLIKDHITNHTLHKSNSFRHSKLTPIPSKESKFPKDRIQESKEYVVQGRGGASGIKHYTFPKGERRLAIDLKSNQVIEIEKSNGSQDKLSEESNSSQERGASINSVPRGEENGPRYNPNEILRFDSNGSEKGTNPQKR